MAMRARMRRMTCLAVAASVMGLASCGGGEDAVPTQAPATVTATPSPTTTPLGAGDLSACKAYGRTAPKAADMMNALGSLPTSITGPALEGFADDLDTGGGTAVAARLTVPLDGTSAALRSMAATIAAYREGTLDLNAEATALWESSSEVAAACAAADPAGSYSGIKSDDG